MEDPTDPGAERVMSKAVEVAVRELVRTRHYDHKQERPSHAVSRAEAEHRPSSSIVSSNQTLSVILQRPDFASSSARLTDVSTCRSNDDGGAGDSGTSALPFCSQFYHFVPCPANPDGLVDIMTVNWAVIG